MTTLTPHPFAHILEPLARDYNAKFEHKNLDDVWVPVELDVVLRNVLYGHAAPERFRVKPATIRIGEREVPKPRTDKPTWSAMGIGGTLFYWDSASDFAQATNALRELLEGRP